MEQHTGHISFNQLENLVSGDYLHGVKGSFIKDICIDTRNKNFNNGSVFFALKGSKADGHDYLLEAYAKGCTMFVVNDSCYKNNLPTDTAVFVTQDVLACLQALAEWHRSQFDIPVLAITGSNGKTIVKEWLATLLMPEWYVVKSPKSYNSQIGVALSVWNIQSHHELGIFEVGISKKGEMKTLMSMLKPMFGIYTNLGSAHDEGFVSRIEKSVEKAELFKDSDWVVARLEHKEVVQSLKLIGKKTITWSTNTTDANYTIMLTKVDTHQTLIEIYQQKSGDLKSVLAPYSDEVSIENLLHGLVFIWESGFWHARIPSLVHTLSALPMRLEVKKGMHDSILINDAYNNDLAGLRIALDFMQQHKADKEPCLILSEMLESGLPKEVWLHQVHNEIKQSGVKRLYLIGSSWEGWDTTPYNEVLFFKDTTHFLESLHQINIQGSCFLIKGARIYHFEDIVNALSEKSNDATLEIDLNALANNYRVFKNLAGIHTKVMAMVKSFAYGAGMVEVASVLQHQQADYLGVAYTDEGVTLRNAGIRMPIMVLNPGMQDIERLLAFDLEPVVYDDYQLNQWIQNLEHRQASLSIHLEIETGMHRLGASKSSYMSCCALIAKYSNCILLKSVFTHLAASDEVDLDTYTQQQLALFDESIDYITQRIHYPFLTHAYNSAGIVRFKPNKYAMVRLGIGLYGVSPLGTASALPLLPVATWTATIQQIKELPAGATVGYNRKGILKRNSRIAVINVGYGDGLRRCLSNGKGQVYIHQIMVPIVGNICMDMTMIDVTDLPGVQVGDRVEIFGKNAPIHILAAQADTIPYELLTGISPRVRRVFYQD